MANLSRRRFVGRATTVAFGLPLAAAGANLAPPTGSPNHDAAASPPTDPPIASPAMLAPTLSWSFPIARPHAGPALGNGITGLMVWGEGRRLCLTLARAGFWDHRGGYPFAAVGTYGEVRQLVEAGDEAALLARFGGARQVPGQPKRPRQLGLGRAELELPEGYRLVRAELALATATLGIVVQAGDRAPLTLELGLAVPEETAWLRLPPELLAAARLWLLPTTEFLAEELRSIGVPATVWEHSPTGDFAAFALPLPQDDGAALAVQRFGWGYGLGTALGPGAPIAPALQHARAASEVEALAAASRGWWATYWKKLPRLRCPDAVLQELWWYGLYKQGGLTPPHAPAATLQGPWMEDGQFPPWSNDYHFNVNVQMIYQPALSTGCPEHLQPLWAMLRQWRPELSANGRAFFGHPEALMLPHACDDRGQVVGSFWTGSIDHACTAWMALLAWQHWRQTPADTALLHEVVWPLLKGAWAGYAAMAEPDTRQPGCLRLPLSVSPEYNGSGLNACGANANWQLAAAHAVVRALQATAAATGTPADPAWAALSAGLPAYTSAPAVTHATHPAILAAAGLPPVPDRLSNEEQRPSPRLALWEGKDLDASHRHHSHLGGITPFFTLDPADPALQPLLANTLRHWVRTGRGAWSGWCHPWAAQLLARLGRPAAGLEVLHSWARGFVNEGRGTLHDAAYLGLSVMEGNTQRWHPACSITRRALDGTAHTRTEAATREIMQCDAALGLVTALPELCLRPHFWALRGTLPVVGGPPQWADWQIEGLVLPNGDRASANAQGQCELA